MFISSQRGALAVFLYVLPLSAALAQDLCQSWVTGPSQTFPGIDGEVHAVLPWDPDGAGPQPELLVAGGFFGVAGDAACHNLAAWDGTHWRSVGGGVGANDAGGSQPVYALAVYNGDLIVGGAFLTAGDLPVGRVARWDGRAWHSLGAGFDATVRALTTFDGDLAAGGDFTTADGLPVGYVSLWNGASWRAVGQGMNSSVWSLVEFDGKLHAGGAFRWADGNLVKHIARWNGTRWGRLGGGFEGVVYSLAVFDGQLHAGGAFSETGDGVPVYGVGRWTEGRWEPLGSGPLNHANVLLVRGDKLFACAGGRVVQWDRSMWTVVGYPGNGWSYALGSFAGVLILAGDFNGLNELPTAHSIAGYDSSRWGTLTAGFNAPVNAFTVFNGELIAGGQFVQAGGTQADRAAAWNGRTWRALGVGFNSTVRSFATFRDQLYAGGSFSPRSSGDARFLARWDGASWRSVAEFGGYGVYDMLVWNDRLVLAGAFTRIGSLTVNGAVAWDGATWTALGLPGALKSIAVFDGELYAAQNGPGRVMRWDGAEWRTFATCPDGTVDVLRTHAGELVAAGGFEQIGGVAAQAIARWNGVEWRPLPPGLDGSHTISNFQVNALLSVGQDLFVGGAFATIEGQTFNRIARWDGSRWHRLGGGVSSENFDWSTEIFALAAYRDEIIAGGYFSSAGGVPSAYWARWAPRSGCDANCDGTVNQFDLQPFIERLAGRTVFPCSACAADANADGTVNQFDIQPFITCLSP